MSKSIEDDEKLAAEMWLKYGQTTLTGLRSMRADDAVLVIKNAMMQRPDVQRKVLHEFGYGPKQST